VTDAKRDMPWETRPLAEPRLGTVLHRDHAILHISREICILLGYIEAGAMPATALDLLDDPARAGIIEDEARLLRGDLVSIRQVALRRRNGSSLGVVLSQELVPLPGGTAIAWAIGLGLEPLAREPVMDDMAQMRHDLRMMRAAIDAVPVGLWLTGENEATVLHNRLFETYGGIPLGLLETFKTYEDLQRYRIRHDSAKLWLDEARFTPAQIAATPSLATILRCQKERQRDEPMSEEEMLARIAWASLGYGPEPRPDGLHWSIPVEFTRGDTGEVIELRSNPVPGIGWIQVLTDVTARRRAEEEVRSANTRLEATVAELRAAQAQLILQEKMATLGQLTAGIAHEIKNPLNFINNFAGLTSELVGELGERIGTPKSPEVEATLATIARNVKIIEQHGQRTDAIVRTMLLHARTGASEWSQVDLVALLQDACNLAIHGARANYTGASTNLVRRFPKEAVVSWILPQDIMRVILNLLSNAFYAVAKRAEDLRERAYRPEIVITLSATGNKVAISIRDNGIGMNDTVKAKLFTPFFTTKAPGEGTGLGLSLSYDVIVQGHGGDLKIDSETLSHTEVRLTLPRREGPLGTPLENSVPTHSRA
jgi:signal transduction histidine kinase